MRINKYLTRANYCSRRKADDLVKQKRVKINDQHAVLGDKVEEGDKVYVDGEQIEPDAEKIYLAYNKPVGVISTTDKSAKDNIIDAISYDERVYPVGRLDVKTSGLILLTNDGSVVNKILKSRGKVEKEYVVTLDKAISDSKLKKLEKGMVLGERKTLPAEASRISQNKFTLILTEGRNKQIRRMLDKLGFTVTGLKRVRIGHLHLDKLGLDLGKYKKLKAEEINKLVESE